MGSTSDYQGWLSEILQSKKISSFDRSLRRQRYQTTPGDDQFLDALNFSLLGFNESLREKDPLKPFPTILVVSPPRSGTTLLTQKLAETMSFGYISNLMARFYGAPLVGARLQKMLISDEMRTVGVQQSTQGLTRYIFEPNEFGYFWGFFLPFLGDSHAVLDSDLFNTRRNSLSETLSQFTTIFDQPTVVKCSIGPFVLEELLKDKNVLIATVHRDRYQTAASILRTRKERLGSEQAWWSVRPKNWRELLRLDARQQVLEQVESVETAIASASEKHLDRVFAFQYESLISSPKESILDFTRWVNHYTEKLKGSQF